jgi:hypothetical protein
VRIGAALVVGFDAGDGGGEPRGIHLQSILTEQLTAMNQFFEMFAPDLSAVTLGISYPTIALSSSL